MEIEITGGTAGLVLLLLGFLLLGGSIITERGLIGYYKRCIRKGVQEYKGQQIRHLSEYQMERWQRVYTQSIKNSRRLGIYTQLPYYVATIIILIVIFIPLAMVEGATVAPWWILFPIWMIFLTIVSLGRASKLATEFSEMRYQ